jgi:DNA repair exonuclease SbcCD ATPase subunit
MDDLTKLEVGLDKLSSMFLSSIHTLQRYAPIISINGEDNMENSAEHKERLAIENIENYNENKEKYDELVNTHANDINKLFNELDYVINNLKSQEEYTKTDVELKNEIKSLKQQNEEMVKELNDKIKLTEDIVNNIRKESEYDLHINRSRNKFQ